MVRPAGVEAIATEKNSFLHVPIGENCHATQGHRGKCQDQSGSRRSKRKMWARVLIIVSVGRNRQVLISKTE